VFIELPEISKHVAGGAEVAVVESVKAAADVYAPLSGVVTEVNQVAADAPESVNETPYDSWLFKMSPDNAADFSALADAVTYRQMLGD
jgi:glycine cleavage system H protein